MRPNKKHTRRNFPNRVQARREVALENRRRHAHEQERGEEKMKLAQKEVDILERRV